MPSAEEIDVTDVAELQSTNCNTQTANRLITEEKSPTLPIWTRSPKALTAKIRSRQSIAAILSPPEPPAPEVALEPSSPRTRYIEAVSSTDPEVDRTVPPARPAVPQSSTETRNRVEGTAGEAVGADEGIKRDTNSQQDGGKPAKMRSSVACARCRRSKIKCINAGTNTVCVPCHQNNRECTYPAPSVVSSSSAKRSEHPSGTGIDGEGETKRPRRKEADNGSKHSHRTGEDPLETPPITSKLWREIYQLFMQHYSAELSFLHKQTFFDRIREIEETGRRSRETQLFLLGVLSLTARFVPELVSYPYPSDPSRNPHLRSGDPLNASEFYAHALEARIDAVTMATPSLDILQALLMLGLHNWGMCRGLRSWVWVGAATRLAFAMGLSSEETIANTGKPNSVSVEELELLGMKRKVVEAGPRHESHTSVHITIQEIKRRIMWSCFILDRYLCSGRRRPQMIVETLYIQLPCTDVDFQFRRNVRTEFLYPDTDFPLDDHAALTGQSAQVGSSSILNFYIRLVEIWGRFSKWSCAGGRRKEQYIPPWDQRTEFFRLRKQLDDFEDSLPPDLAFNSENLEAHAQGSSITVYTAIHTLCSLCKIVLHREYIPFIPLRCKRPIGPLDEPTFPREKHDIPTDFWEESAEEIFKAAKQIIQIVSANSKRWVSSESPQVAFAIWTAAFVGVYSRKFPHMDIMGHMNSGGPNNDLSAIGEPGNDATSLALTTLTEMSSRLKMAHGWSKTTKRMLEYFTRIIQDYNRNSSPLSRKHNPRSLSAERSLSLREGGGGGGLEEYKVVEKELKDFGSIEEEDRNSTPTASDMTESRASTSGPALTPSVKAEMSHAVEHMTAGRHASESTWAAVNSSSSTGNGLGDLGRRASYSFSGGPNQSINVAQEAAHYQQQQQQPRPNGPTSHSSGLITAQQNLVDLSSSYSQSELARGGQTESYYSPQAILHGYPYSSQNAYSYDQAGDPQDWGFDGHLSGVPAWEWPPDGDANFYDTGMHAIQNQNALPNY